MQASDLLSGWRGLELNVRRLVVAVSGGADSVALLLAMKELLGPDRLVAAHFNHQWRGAESDGDASFVQRLARDLSVRCLLGVAESEVSQNDSFRGVEVATLAKGVCDASESDLLLLGSESDARRQRYEFLIQCAYEVGASYVVTAHTAGDRVETLLHNLFRGSGLAGLSSLRMFRSLDKDLVLARPLITKSRQDVLNFLQERNQSFREDSSNRNIKYKRNFLRAEILPRVTEVYGDASENVLRFSEHIESLLSEIEKQAFQWIDMCAVQSGPINHQAWPTHWTSEYWVGDRAAMKSAPWYVAREGLRLLWLKNGWRLADMAQRHWDELRVQIFGSAAGGQHSFSRVGILPGGIAIEIAGPWIAVGKLAKD